MSVATRRRQRSSDHRDGGRGGAGRGRHSFQSATALRAVARIVARAVLCVYGIRLRVLGRTPLPRTQTVYISNHTSTLDLFVLVALGLPNCRFFLSGFVRKFVPLGVIATAWARSSPCRKTGRRNVDASSAARPASSDERESRSTSVLRDRASPLARSATSTRVRSTSPPTCTCRSCRCISTCRGTIDPGRGYSTAPGTVTVHVLPPIDTTAWRVDEVVINKEQVRDTFVRIHEDLQCA